MEKNMEHEMETGFGVEGLGSEFRVSGLELVGFGVQG